MSSKADFDELLCQSGVVKTYVLRLPLLSDVYLYCLESSNIINRKTLFYASKGYVCQVSYIAFPCRDIRPVEF